MKKVLFTAAAALLLSVASCQLISQKANEMLGSMPMDEAATYELVQEQLAKIEPEWKVYEVSVANKGVPSECSNTFGHVSVQMVNADNDCVSQIIYPDKTAPKEAFGTGPAFADAPELPFSAELAMKQINECKEMIPEGFKFLNLERYDVDYISKTNSYRYDVIINVQEEGKETVTAGGVTSSVYYSLLFHISPDGQIEMKEN
ncbi:MAG: hypothetical protein K2L21_00625 [Muribaculaceae bacterium]|nr:hypothetical protein [Muribaculaceae bacterium]